jgi:hypothetical protein
MKKQVFTSNVLTAITLFIFFAAITNSVSGQKQDKPIQTPIPGTHVSLTPPPYFELTKDAENKSFFHHPGTNAVIQAVSVIGQSYEKFIALYNDEYFQGNGLQVLMTQHPELADGSSTTLFICSTAYKNAEGTTSTDYRVLIMVGGNSNESFMVTARYPELASELLLNEIMNSFFTVQIIK